MSAGKFTPGEWVVVPEPDCPLLMVGADGVNLVIDYKGAYCFPPADAHLIAAAKDLYAALEACQKWVCGERIQGWGNQYGTCAQINAALAKARGES